MKTNLLRNKFLKFFETKKHKIVASDSLVPAGDPTVLFTSAGMNQFKKQFMGQVSDFRRAASSQKCLRTDDLEKVGKTPFHHTFFEMLGNFSFGDYFKKDAIHWAWEFLTEWLKIPKEKLWISVYKDDDEAYDIWAKEIKVFKEKIIKLGDKENFWPSEAKQKGPNGPCGPCSEIFYDYGKGVGCGKKNCNPSCDCGRFAEVWNLVFTQFNRKEDGSLGQLPNKNIDTGMGLERLAAVMQSVLTNFETDLFVPIIDSIKKEATITRPKAGQLTTIKIIADHIRAIAFAVCDGVNPSNEDRGYIVRKLIRISVNNCRSLGIRKPLLYKIISVIADTMKEAYPELLKRRENISQIIKREEESFLKIVEKQDAVSLERMKNLRKECDDNKKLALEMAKLAFELHDTFGYPYESTEASADKLKLPIDKKTFDQLMHQQKKRSRQSSAMGKDVFKEEEIKMDLKPTKFVGYQKAKDTAKILKIFDENNKEVKSTKGLNEVKIILDQTPFYAESGGQIGDRGIISKDKDSKIEIVDTKVINEVIVHNGSAKKGELKVGDKVSAEVDRERRLSIARNHTATHLLQAALRQVLGEHVQQQGSLVAEDRLRFDFTHFKQLSKKELDRVEELVNEFIMNNDSVSIEEKSTEQAKKEGALAFFAEKYAEKSRIISIGDYSKELCGGTHIDSSTGQIGLFKIISESSIAQGIRRIEATTGKFAYRLVKQEEGKMQELSKTLKTDASNLLNKISKLINSVKSSERKLSNIKMESIKGSLDKIISKAKEENGVKIISENVDDVDFGALRSIIDMLKKKLTSAVICLGSVKDGKALIVLGVTDNLKDKGFNASDMIKEIAAIVGGTGGGRPDLAQAGGNLTDKLSQALNKVYGLVKDKKK
ncbi:MAG: alanine--tRNA ligase [Candidatus Omnitrophota bacterium]